MKIGRIIFKIILLLGIVFSGFAQADINDGLVAHYEFEGNAKDSSGNGNNGVEHGGVTYVDGVIGKAVVLDKPNKYININKSLEFKNYTVTYFVKVNNYGNLYGDSGASNEILSGANSHNDNAFEFYFTGDKKVAFCNDYLGCGKSDESVDFLNKWIFVSYVRKDNKITIYLNQNKLYTYNSSKNSTISIENLVIGKDQDCVGGCFADNQSVLGLIDDLRIYNRALSDEEIKKLYKLGQFPETRNLSKGLVAWYEFENGFFNKITNQNENNNWINQKNITIENGYLKLINRYDGDKKRYIKTKINTSNIDVLMIEKRTKLTTKDNYTQSSTSFENSNGERISIEYNNYHYTNGDLSHTVDTQNNEHFYIFNRWDYKDANHFKYKLSKLVNPIWNKWFYERIIVNYKDKKVTYKISQDGINYEQIYINNIQFKRDTNTTLQFSAWDWANGSEHIIDYLKIYTEANNNASINLSKGLVAHYKFEGNAKDSSRNGNDGVEHGGVTYVDGVIGKAAKFDGVDDWITLPTFDKIWKNGITICSWAKFKEKNRYFERIVDFGNGNGDDGGTPIWFGREDKTNNLAFESWINDDPTMNREKGRIVKTNGIINEKFVFYCASIKK